MIAHAETHSVSERSSVPLPPHEAHQDIQLHTNPSVKSPKVKSTGSEKVQGEKAQPFNTPSIIQLQLIQLVELLPTPAQLPALGKYLPGSKEKPRYQLKGLWRDQLIRKQCKNKARENWKIKNKGQDERY